MAHPCEHHNYASGAHLLFICPVCFIQCAYCTVSTEKSFLPLLKVSQV